MSSNSVLSDGSSMVEDDLYPLNPFWSAKLVSGINSDCEFVVGSQNVIIKGHKLIFAMASDVFQAMFYGELKEDSVVKIEDLEPDGFEGMKNFIYTGEAIFKSAIEALSTLIAAQKYIIPHLCEKCNDYINQQMSPSEVLEFYEYANSKQAILGLYKFDEICHTIIKEETKDVVQSAYFLRADIDTMELILKSPSMNLKSELEVFDHFERWIHAEAARREIDVQDEIIATSFDSLKKNIRFLTMSSRDFSSRAAKSVSLTLKEKFAIVMNLINFGSAPYPENLSSIKETRDFHPSNKLDIPVVKVQVVPKGKSYSKTLVVNLDRYCGPCSTFHLDVENSSWVFILFHFEKNICFKFQPSQPYNVANSLFIVRSKLRVLAKKRCDDLLIIDECKVIMDKSRKAGTSQDEVIFAAIPLKKLRSNCFLRDKTATIECNFYIEKIIQ